MMMTIIPVFGAEVFIPHLTGTNTAWGSYLQVDNVSNGGHNYQVVLYDQSGNQVYDKTYTIYPLEHALLDLSDLAPAGVCGRITYEPANLKFRLSYESKIGGGLAEFALSEITDLNQVFFFSDFSPVVQWKGIAVANLNSTSANGLIYAMGNGEILGEKLITIGPRTRVKGLFTNWFPGVKFGAIKSIVITSSDQKLCGIAISGDQDSSKLLFTAASPLLTDFSGGSQGTPLDGNWDGEWISTSYPGERGRVVMDFQEDGDHFSGTTDVYDTDCGDVFGVPVSGTIQGDTYSFESSYVCMGYTATLSFTEATLVNGDYLQGKYTELVDGEFYDRGTFYLRKTR
jgi:hypothetical protein